MDLLPLRLDPGADLRRALEDALRGAGWPGAFVVSGIGSLSDPRLRLAGAPQATVLDGPFELVSLSGSITPDGAHLHATVSDARGAVTGGHVVDGNRVRTTAEVLLAAVSGWTLSREPDAATGYRELVARRA